jgi:DNA-binding SARP family transcriptional activator
LSLALDEGIETDYVRELIRLHELVPPDPDKVSEPWPWPVKISALGGLQIETATADSSVSRKTEKRPLQLLKILLAAGTTGLLVEQVIEDLCPERGGKSAYNIYSVTLHRLRQRLGQERYLLSDGGVLRLNRHFCWVDTWEFSRLCRQRNPHSAGIDSTEQQARKLERAIELYQGRFLAGQTDTTSQLVYSEELSRQFIQVIFARAKLLEKKCAWEKTIQVYQQGLQQLPQHEPFYRAIMFCYGQFGYHDGVRQTYQRCREALARNLTVAPSAETEKLYRKLLG